MGLFDRYWYRCYCDLCQTVEKDKRENRPQDRITALWPGGVCGRDSCNCECPPEAGEGVFTAASCLDFRGWLSKRVQALEEENARLRLDDTIHRHAVCRFCGGHTMHLSLACPGQEELETLLVRK